MERTDAFSRGGRRAVPPRSHARSPWSADMLHGRLLAGLAVRERRDVIIWTVASGSPASPSTCSASCRWRRSPSARPGRGTAGASGPSTSSSRARAATSPGRALAARRAGDAPGSVWRREPWNAPTPSTLAAPDRSPEADAMGAPDLRFVGRGLDGPGHHRAWLREPWALVDGEPLTPYVRAVIAADVVQSAQQLGRRGTPVHQRRPDRVPRPLPGRGVDGAARSPITSTTTGSRSARSGCTTRRGRSATSS